MFGQRAAELIRELERTSHDALPPYKAEGVRAVCDEMKAIYEANQRDFTFMQSQSQIDATTQSTIKNTLHFRDLALKRNNRCLIAYHYNRIERLRNLRWFFGGIIPTNIRQTLSEKETEWFSNYSKSLTNYMMAISELPGEDVQDEDLLVLDLTVHQRPPKEYFIDVKVLMDYGNYETQDGETIFLKKHLRLCLPRTECEHLIRQGVLQHVQ